MEPLDWSVSPEVRFGATAAPGRFRSVSSARRRRSIPRLMLESWSQPDLCRHWHITRSVECVRKRQSRLRINTRRANVYRAHNQWLAQRYGYHPAVLGFAIGNETNCHSSRHRPYIDYWKYLNRLGAIAKRYAPGKLTMTAFADYPSTEEPMLLNHCSISNMPPITSRRTTVTGVRRYVAARTRVVTVPRRVAGQLIQPTSMRSTFGDSTHIASPRPRTWQTLNTG